MNSLNKLEENEDLIKSIPLNEIFDIFITSYDNYKDCQQFGNQILLQLSLMVKILLKNKNIEKTELSRFCENNKNIINKVLEYLQEIPKNSNWIEKKDKFCESVFIESFEHLQNKFNIYDKNLIGIYSPILYNTYKESNSENEKKDKKEEKTETAIKKKS